MILFTLEPSKYWEKTCCVFCCVSAQLLSSQYLHVSWGCSFICVKPDCWFPSTGHVESHEVAAVVLWTSSWGQQTLSEPTPLQSRSCSTAGKTRWALTSTKLLHPWHCSSTSGGPRGDLLSTWGTPVVCPMWWLASLLEIPQLVAGTPTGRFRISLKVLGAGSFYKVVGPMREANLFCCHDGIGQKWRAKKKKILFGSVPILAGGSNNMAGRVGAWWCLLEEGVEVLLHLCKYVNVEMVIFKGSFNFGFSVWLMRNKSCEDEGEKTALSSEGGSIRGNGNVTTGSWRWLISQEEEHMRKAK